MAGTPAVAQLVRTVLGGPHSELAMKRQILSLAQQNLHLPDVPAALIEALPKVVDRETRASLLGLIFSLDLARLPSVEPLHDALLVALKEEKERAMRVSLLERLGRGLARDARLLPAFLETVADPNLSDPEREAAAGALRTLPTPSEQAALAALTAAQRAPNWVRQAAVDLATRTPQLTDALVAGLTAFLEPNVDASLRLSILQKFATARRLGPQHLPALKTILRTESDAGERHRALDLLAQVAPWTGEQWEELLRIATTDGDEMMRAKAIALQRDAPEPSPEVLAQLCAQLAKDSSLGVRMQILDLLKRSLRLPEVRAALARAFAESAPQLADGELIALVDALAPYASRDAELRERLLGAVEKLPRPAQRQAVLSRVLTRIKVDDALPLLTRLFGRERDENLRGLLFKTLRPLSLARHPELIQAFCEELLEPGSGLRIECASALGPAAEEHPQAAEALAEVIRTETQRELVRACLDGYLRPRVVKTFPPLLAVVKNDQLDTTSRQKALEELVKLSLTDAESLELAEALSGMPQGALRVPTTPAGQP